MRILGYIEYRGFRHLATLGGPGFQTDFRNPTQLDKVITRSFAAFLSGIAVLGYIQGVEGLGVDEQVGVSDGSG